MKVGYVYFLANKPRGTIYLGVTSDLTKRIFEHKSKIFEGFSKKYNCTSLVYFEKHDSIELAINREKQLKNWKRDWKIKLIEEANVDWHDLYDTCLQ